MSKPNKTRAIRLSDEAWNELKRRANEHNLRGRAEYLEMLCKEDESSAENYIKWDGAKGWWAGNRLDQYKPKDDVPAAWWDEPRGKVHPETWNDKMLELTIKVSADNLELVKTLDEIAKSIKPT